MFNAPMAGQRSSGAGVVIGSCVGDYSSSCGNSYGSAQNQLWQNIEETPAISIIDDPESSGPFYLGNYYTSEAVVDPVLVGQAGKRGTYWLLDGSQYWIYTGWDALVAPVLTTGFFKDLHKTTGGKDFGFFFSFRFQSNATIQSLFTTKAAGHHPGVNAYITSTRKLVLSQDNGTIGTLIQSTATLTDDTDYVIGVSHSHPQNKTRLWVGAAPCEEFSDTFKTTTAACTAPLIVGAACDITQTAFAFGLENGTRVYDMVFTNAFNTDSEYSAMKTLLLARRTP